jgi:hypothetical protein
MLPAGYLRLLGRETNRRIILYIISWGGVVHRRRDLKDDIHYSFSDHQLILIVKNRERE